MPEDVCDCGHFTATSCPECGDPVCFALCTDHIDACCGVLEEADAEA